MANAIHVTYREAAVHFMPDHPRAVAYVTMQQLEGLAFLARWIPCFMRHQRFMEEGRGDLKKAKLLNNCIKYPFFIIPLSQVC